MTKGELANFAFEKWRDSYVAETKQQNWLPVEDLVIALPKMDGPQVLVEKADDGQTYFAIQDYPAPGRDGPATAAPRPSRWWSSGTPPARGAGDHRREIVAPAGYLERLLPDQRRTAGKPKIAVDLVLLRERGRQAHARSSFVPANPSALTAELEKVQYDGGTQLGAIGPIAGAEKPDLYLLFTDGISNFGREEPARLDAPLYIFSADATANHAFLHSLAMTNGGRYFNLANWKDADVLARHRPPGLVVPFGRDQGRGSERPLSATAPAVGRPVHVGRQAHRRDGHGDGRLRRPRREARRANVQDLAFRRGQGSLLRRLWAQKKLAELMIHQKPNQKEITALGKQFGLVTPYTSLLVLDSLEQYVQYEIAPPKSLAAMREEYMRRIDTLEHQKQKQKADKLAEVVRMWEERVKWWNAEFKYPKDFKYKGDRRSDETASASGRCDGSHGSSAPRRACPRRACCREMPAGSRGAPPRHRVPARASVSAHAASAAPASAPTGAHGRRTLANFRCGDAVEAGRERFIPGRAVGQGRKQQSETRSRQPGNRHQALEARHAVPEGIAGGQGQGRTVGRLHEEPRRSTARRPASSSTAPTSSARRAMPSCRCRS